MAPTTGPSPTPTPPSGNGPPPPPPPSKPVISTVLLDTLEDTQEEKAAKEKSAKDTEKAAVKGCMVE